MQLLARHKRAFLLSGIGLCIIAIVLTVNPGVGSNILSGLSNGVSYIVTPMQRGLSAAITWVQGHFTALVNNQYLIIRNRELREEIYLLQLANSQLRLAAEENESLGAILNMRQRYAQLPSMGARVIGQDPNDWHRSFHIDIGANDGVQADMAVFANDGLAGVVRYVHPNRAQFVSVIDSRFAAGVMSLRTEDMGTLRGEVGLMQDSLMRMDHIDAAAQIMPGDEIVTSAHSLFFPPGLRVGTVLSIHSNPDGLTRYAIIQPAVDVDNIQVGGIVLVVMEIFGGEYNEEGYIRSLEE